MDREWLAKLGYDPDGFYNVDRPQNDHSVALEASRLSKVGEGLLFGFTVMNTKASAQFILVFDASALPADGVAPACVFSVAASTVLPVQYIPSRTFRQGLVICNSSTAATKTIGAADCYFDVQYL